MSKPTITPGDTGSIEILTSGNIGEHFVSGTYWVDTSCTGLPEGQSAGFLTVATAQISGTVHGVHQTFTGLIQYSDIRLAEYKRYAFPADLSSSLQRTSWLRARD